MTVLLKLIPDHSRFDFAGKRGLALLFSGILTFAALTSILTQGLNFGIDFAGGVLIEIETPQKADVGAIRSKLDTLHLGEVGVTTFGSQGNDVSIRIGVQEGGDAAQKTTLDRVKEALGPDVIYQRVEVVGPKVGDELIQDGIAALGLSILAIAAYIWVRFDWQFAVGALASLLHDVIMTIGVFSLFQIPFDLTVVAGLMTLAGYSINDTVVQYDRVRENRRRYRSLSVRELVNVSLNEVLARTILTVVTVFLAAMALLVFGGEVLYGFSLCMTLGVIVGTYSSFYIAMPLLLYFLKPLADKPEEEKASEGGEDTSGFVPSED